MHYLDLGLFHYQIEYTRELLKKIQSNLIVDEIDRRLVKIPRFLELKIFSHGIQSIVRLTANKYQNLMKVMVLVIEYFIENKELAFLYQAWNEMYIISRYEEFSQNDLDMFKVRINLIFMKTFEVLQIFLIIIKLF